LDEKQGILKTTTNQLQHGTYRMTGEIFMFSCTGFKTLILKLFEDFMTGMGDKII
jgi:hypothetical protein